MMVSKYGNSQGDSTTSYLRGKKKKIKTNAGGAMRKSYDMMSAYGAQGKNVQKKK